MKYLAFHLALIAVLSFATNIARPAVPTAAVSPSTNASATVSTDEANAQKTPQQLLASRTFVKEYKLDELAPLVNRNINRGRNFEKGKQLFSDLACIVCHHFGPDGGGVGPDLTGVSGRYTPKDLLEEILDPSKRVSDLYASSVLRKKNGEIINGRVTADDDTAVTIMEDLLAPSKLTVIKRADIDSVTLSEVSPMPEGLLVTAKEEEIYDLVAFLLSSGDPKDNAYRPALTPTAPVAPPATNTPNAPAPATPQRGG